MSNKLVKTLIFCGIFSVSSLSFGDSYTTKDGYTVECNGYDSDGNWVSCPDNSSDDDSMYNKAKKKYEEAKEALDPANWSK